jgi:hypothetical protein
MKKVTIILLLWAIAYFATIIIINNTHSIIIISPVFAICMISSIITVRQKKQ